MKALVVIVLLLVGVVGHKCTAQTAAKGKRGRTCSPITLFLKSRTILEKGRWSLCADVAMNKNSLPYSRLGGNLLKQYHGSAPVYSAFSLNSFCAIEGGAYLGMVANRAEALGELPLPAYVDTSYDLGFDSGLVSGLSFDLEKFGRLRLRYNYGLSKILNIDDRIVKTRRLDLGLNVRF
ncbi:MAG: hypothetical protein R2824_31580 [Saprospiraceae bacterium]|nr:hypothetical protein [Lewinella sp.]